MRPSSRPNPPMRSSVSSASTTADARSFASIDRARMGRSGSFRMPSCREWATGTISPLRSGSPRTKSTSRRSSSTGTKVRSRRRMCRSWRWRPPSTRRTASRSASSSSLSICGRSSAKFARRPAPAPVSMSSTNAEITSSVRIPPRNSHSSSARPADGKATFHDTPLHSDRMKQRPTCSPMPTASAWASEWHGYRWPAGRRWRCSRSCRMRCSWRPRASCATPACSPVWRQSCSRPCWPLLLRAR